MTRTSLPKLYDYAASANCYKVRLLLAQLDVEYERVPVDIFNGETLTDAYRDLNPQRTTPVLQLPDGRTVTESNAILWWLASGTPFLPEDPFDQAQVCRWLIYEQSDVVPTIGSLRYRLITGRLGTDKADATLRIAQSYEVLRFVDDYLDGRLYLVADQYSIADIAIFAYTHVAHEAGLDTGRFPSVRNWLTRINSDPRFMNDLQPYPPNATAHAGRSIYD
jgi:glutathione S-transferase